MKEDGSRLTAQDILEKVKRLEPRQIEEVMDFIDFLAERKPPRSPLVQLLHETSGARAGLEEVRKRLAKISGKVSDTVRELRDERG